MSVIAPTDRSGEQCHAGRDSAARMMVAGACLLYLALTIWFHYDRSWRGDEVGTYLAFDDSYPKLFRSFGGWETMNFYLMGLKAIHEVGGTNWLLVLPGMVCGVWLVWLSAALARQLGASDRAACAAALLVAVNPWLITHGATIRSYIVLAAFSTAMLLALFRCKETGRWWDGFWCGLCGAIALLSHLNALYTIAAAGAIAACWFIAALRQRNPGWLGHWVRLAAPCLILIGLAAVAYWRQVPDIRHFREIWSDTPPIPLTFLPSTFAQFFGDGYLAVPPLLALLFAAWRIIRGKRQSQWLLLASITVVASISLAGVSHYLSAYARFLIAILPWLVIAMADGVWSGQDCRLFRWTCIVLLMVCSLAATDDLRKRYHRLPWHRIAADMQNQTRKGDQCMLLGPAVNTAALRVYGVQAGVNAASILKACEPEKPLRLVIADMAGGRPTQLPGTPIGDARIVVVAGTPQQIASELLNDLIAGAAGKVDGNMAPVYQQISSLLKWTGRASEAPQYDALREQSQAMNAHTREAPPQLSRRRADSE